MTETYGYDNAGQLLSIVYKQADGTVIGDLSHTYNAAGNRMTTGGTLARTGLPTAIANRQYDANNRLTNSDGVAQAYDNNGNLTNDGGHAYAWNVRDKLVTIGGADTAGYAYDAFGRRRAATINGQAILTLHDGWNPIQLKTGAGVVVENRLVGLGLDTIYSRTRAGVTESFLKDALGSTLELRNAAQAKTVQYTYGPYGGTTSSVASTNRMKYTGREQDLDDLYYYRNRYYKPSAVRFISEDPVGLAGGGNLYAYVGGNPLSFVDPLGLDGTGAWLVSTWHIGDTSYGFLSPNPNAHGRLNDLIGGRASNKCNFFVNDMLAAGGDPPGKINGRIPSASEWANPNVQIDGYYVLPGWYLPKEGDVVAYDGHVGIFATLDGGGFGTISASANEQSVVHNDWGLRPGQSPTIRRCECDK